MSLLVRINLALGVVFVAAALIAGYACRTILEANAQREVFAEAAAAMVTDLMGTLFGLNVDGDSFS
jgi:hypothetical protein